MRKRVLAELGIFTGNLVNGVLQLSDDLVKTVVTFPKVVFDKVVSAISDF